MYNKEMTEFDVRFNQKLFPDRPKNEYRPFKDIVSKKGLQAFQKAHDRNEAKKACLGMFICFLVMIADAIGLIVVLLANIPTDGNFVIMFSTMMSLPVLVFWVFSIILVSTFGIHMINGESEYIGSHTEIQFEGNGKATVKEVNDYSNTFNPAAPIINIFLFVTAMIWYIPYWIYIKATTKKMLLKFVSQEIIDAYEYAMEATVEFKIKQSKMRDYVKFISSKTKYHKKVKETIERYSYLGQEKAKEHARNIPLVALPITTKDNKNYLIVDNSQFAAHEKDTFFLLARENGVVVGKILRGSIFLATDDINWLDDWKRAGAHEITLDMIDEYIKLI